MDPVSLLQNLLKLHYLFAQFLPFPTQNVLLLLLFPFLCRNCHYYEYTAVKNNKKKELTIVTTSEPTTNHVARVKQTRTQKVVPTIDIRKSDIKELSDQKESIDQILKDISKMDDNELRELFIK